MRAAIVALLEDCPRVTLREDDFGNLIAHYRGAARADAPAATRFVRTWITRVGSARRTVRMSTRPHFLGGVPRDVSGSEPGTRPRFRRFAMWDLPPFEIARRPHLFPRLRRSDRLRGDRGDFGEPCAEQMRPASATACSPAPRKSVSRGAIEMARVGLAAATRISRSFPWKPAPSGRPHAWARPDRPGRRQDSQFSIRPSPPNCWLPPPRLTSPSNAA